MSRALQSQWDFGESPEKEDEPHVYGVGELTEKVKHLLEREIGDIWVTGEISNLRVQSSGHVYFSVKDSRSQLSCVLFRGEARALDRKVLCDGQKVLIHGDLTVYEVRGQYQLRVSAVELKGVGALQIAFEQLKQKLNREGLFSQERKRPLPRFARRIGIATSSTAAALRDVLHVIRERNPSLELILAPCLVQGQGAAEEIVSSIRLLNEWNALDLRQSGKGLDLILVTRGGGSLEDLWAFNEEIVARAIFESRAPIVSAVGHEIDFTISDFVADVRCATPSVAAELVTQAVFVSKESISAAPRRLRKLAAQGLDDRRANVSNLLKRVERAHPRRSVEEKWQRLDDVRTTLARFGRLGFASSASRFCSAFQRLQRLKPLTVIERRRAAFERSRSRLAEIFQLRLNAAQSRLQHGISRLRLLSPDSVLTRGYSITTDAVSGTVIREAASVKHGQRLKTRVKSGEFQSWVEKL